MSIPENSNTASPSAPGGSGADWNARWVDGDTPWDKGGPHPALVEWLNKNEVPTRVLIPGCGAGYDVRAFSARGVETVGLDIAPAAISTAEKFPRFAHETYRQANFFALPDEFRNSFDAVFEHTCFCAIDPAWRPAYVAAAAAALKPGGKLLGIFYINPGHEREGPPYGCPVPDLDAYFEGTFQLQEEFFPIPTFSGRENRERMRLYSLI